MAEIPNKKFWEIAGGATDYNAEWKERILKHLEKVLQKQGIPIGNTILDLGAGARPISRFIASKDSKVIYVDFNRPLHEDAQSAHLHIDRDIEKLLHTESTATLRSRVKAAHFLGQDPRAASLEQVDTVIISDLLNYVPAREVIKEAYTYIKLGGVIIVFNQPKRTFSHSGHMLHPKGAVRNNVITDTLKEIGMKQLYSETTKNGYFIGMYQK